MKTNLTGKDLKSIGYAEGKPMGVALSLRHHYRHQPKDEVLALLKKVLQYPETFLEDPILKPLAQVLQPIPEPAVAEVITLKSTTEPYAVYGSDYIEPGARAQMDIAMQLPVTVGGALMPDAHQGYGLPIGGVLATNNAVIPYGVGVDIGCRMALTVFDIPETHFLQNQAQYKRELIAHTKFGAGQGFKGAEQTDHPVLSDPLFQTHALIRSLHGKAISQLGTSGGGNHFVEWGVIEFPERDKALNVPAGRYLALLTHSGSRGLGATIAGHYTRIAKDLCRLPREAANLAYLSLDSTAGQEYWLAMNLAGEYASACHEVIHNKLIEAVGGQVLARVENHHNFAWKETLNGQDVLVHRKGATPAGKGVMGIIPGSMTAPGFLVRGKGESAAIHSASHGAGRQMSRSQAVKSLSRNDLKKVLADHGVSLIGAGLDEAPMAYKDIHKVMAAQTDLVSVVATFQPKIVRMADDGSKED
ncbi:MAG: RtcB family protein [Sphingobacteriales bacterium]|nr:MAG: RtcB family protein [Sphingobacteriales bacterium]